MKSHTGCATGATTTIDEPFGSGVRGCGRLFYFSSETLYGPAPDALFVAVAF